MKFRSIILASTALMALPLAAQAAEELHIVNCGSDTEPQAPVQQKHIGEWEAENPDYTVRVEYLPWEQCQAKTLTLAAAGTPPAAAYMGSRVLKQLSSSEQIVPIEMSEEELSSYEPSVISTVQIGGEVWGLPRAFSTKGLFWNKDLFAEAGLDMPDGPQTFDEMLTAAKAISENTDAAGFGMPAADMDNTFHEFLNFLYSNGGQVVDADGNVVFDSPQNVETLAFYQELAKYSQEGPLAYERGGLEPLFKEGQIGMYTTYAAGRGKAEGVNFGVSLIPAGPQGEHSTLLITDSLVVFKGTGLEEPAQNLIKYLTAPERQAEFDKEGGWTPIRLGADTEALIEEDPTWKPFIDAIPTGGPEPLMTDFVGMQDVAIENIQGVVLGELTPEDAATRIQEDLSALD